ncbi:hypothetical protein PYCCODRAFT_824979 [Trametes coccinea BRFM310]|uniref:Uncharacterized protein n=1 Tax=Trametes coccinea (strain BRFM310) TaxID=1353009 RepID=A0A1Y2IFY8_TRAC3|nr:hypothetical protein PYCCODRAFT_824979 [Trametes coccinea BRFM310]
MGRDPSRWARKVRRRLFPSRHFTGEHSTRSLSPRSEGGLYPILSSFRHLSLSQKALAAEQASGTVKEDISYAPEHNSLLSRSRSSISRLRSLSRASLKRPRGAFVRARPKDAQSTSGSTSRERTPSFAHSRPSTANSSSSASSTPHTPPTHISSLSCFEPDTSEKSRSPSEGDHPPTVNEPTVEAYSSALVPVAAAHRSPKAKSFTSSLRRLRTLSKSSLFSVRKHATQVCQAVPAESSGASPHLSTPTAAEDVATVPLPLTPVAGAVSSPASQDPPLPRLEITEASPRLHIASLELPRFEFVDPRSLTASAPASAVDRISRFWSTPPSPSWLSRNVADLEPALPTNSPPPLPIPPPPSPPLYIVPRSLRPDSYYLREPEIEFEFTTAPSTPRSTASSATLYNPSNRNSLLVPGSPSSANRFIQSGSLWSGHQEHLAERLLHFFGNFGLPLDPPHPSRP